MSSSNAIFSVVMPAYNRASFIVEALDSIQAQTYRPIEIIVVDDGSTDETRDVVAAWGRDNQEEGALLLRYFYQENAGVGAARNRGIKEIRGRYVQFLDSDDRLHPDRLMQLVDMFETENCDFVQTGFEGFDAETEEVIQTIYGRPGVNQLELALQGFLWANTLRSAFTTELVRRIGVWKTEMSCFEDREYVERAVCQAKRPGALRDILASARRGGSDRISDKLRSREGRTWRIYCEARLAEAICHRSDISDAAKRAFASRIYALGFRSNASGWSDLGRECGEIAAKMNVELDALGRRRRFVWRFGYLGGRLHKAAWNLKQVFDRKLTVDKKSLDD